MRLPPYNRVQAPLLNLEIHVHPSNRLLRQLAHQVRHHLQVIVGSFEIDDFCVLEDLDPGRVETDVVVLDGREEENVLEPVQPLLRAELVQESLSQVVRVLVIPHLELFQRSAVCPFLHHPEPCGDES